MHRKFLKIFVNEKNPQNVGYEKIAYIILQKHNVTLYCNTLMLLI